MQRAAIQQEKREITAQDATVYASVLVHLERSVEPGCFMTRDSDFGDPGIKRELREHNCKVLVGFEAGLEFLRRPLPEETP